MGLVRANPPQQFTHTDWCNHTGERAVFRWEWVEEDALNFALESAEVYGDDMFLLADESHSIENQPKVCDAIVFLYNSILDLPGNESARMLRYFISQR